MRILLVEPFYSGSHKQWVDGFMDVCPFEVDLLQLPGKHWKWRMYGGAIELAKQFNALEDSFDVVVVSDMLDLSLFKSLTNKYSESIKWVVYFHENQFAYPWKEDGEDKQQQRDVHYAFKNYTSSLVADELWFNSQYNLNSFQVGVKDLLNRFPDYQCLWTNDEIAAKSMVMPLGFNFKAFETNKEKVERGCPVILWNHRWDHDKQIDLFLKTMYELKEEGYAFELILLGERSEKYENKYLNQLQDVIIHKGFVGRLEYQRLLWKANVLPVCSIQDFFGISIMEAAYCQAHLLLPERLSYPYIFYEAIFYTQDFKQALEEFLKSGKWKDKVSYEFCKEYDWSIVWGKYEIALKELLEN